jgi:hypothetical protein
LHHIKGCQIRTRLLSTMWRKNKETTFWRFAVRISHSWTFECQCLPATKGSNPPNEEFFDAVAHLEAGLTQFSDVNFIGGSVRLFLIAGGNRSLLTRGGWSCMSTRIHLCWAPFQQLLKVVLMYSSLRLRRRERPIPSKMVLVYRAGE